MARAFLRSFEAHSYSYVTKMIDKKAPSGRIRSSSSSTAQTPACIIHEDSASRAIIAKQVARSPEKRGLPRAEGDRVRCDAIMASGVE